MFINIFTSPILSEVLHSFSLNPAFLSGSGQAYSLRGNPYPGLDQFSPSFYLECLRNSKKISNSYPEAF